MNGVRCAALVCVAMLSVRGFAAEQGQKPNVLWLVADDHAAYVTGCYGNPVVRTPNIDRLASQGMRFDRAYCNSPVCTASRQSFQTGRYPRTVGVTLLTTPFPESELTLADLLKTAGYETAGYGKMHFNNLSNHGFDHRADMPQWAAAIKQRGPEPIPQDVKVKGPFRPFHDPASLWLNSETLPLGYLEADMPSTYFADLAVEFLQTKHDKPFFMMVSLPDPHSPYNFPVEFRGKYDPAKVPIGRKGPEDDDQVPAIFRDLTEEQKHGIAAAYYTSTEFMDKQMGRVLDALEKSGQADHTIVIYIGDHGYNLGHHGLFEKHSMYETAVRAPLIVRYPGQVKPAGASAALVEFVDIVPTVLQFCGVEVPKAVQGRSFMAVLTGRSDHHKDHVFSTYAHSEEAMVRDGRWKLVYLRGKNKRDEGYDEGRPLTGPKVKLFDLQNDPDELTNLAGKAGQADRVSRMLKILADHMKQTDRQPEKVPASDDPMVVLDYCTQRNDVAPAKARK